MVEDQRSSSDKNPFKGALPSREVLSQNAVLLIHFVHHATPEDAEGIDKLLDEVDVLVPEVQNCPPEFLRDMQKLTDEDSRALQRVKAYPPVNSFFSTIFDTLHRPRKNLKKIKIAIVDVPATDHWAARSIKLKSLDSGFGIAKSLEDTLAHNDSVAKGIAEIQKARDEVIAKNLISLMESTARDNKEKGRKKPTRILMIIGGLHKGILNRLQDQGINAQTTSGLDNIRFKARDEAILKHMKGETVDRRTLLRIPVEGLLEQYTVSSKYSQKQESAEIEITDKMSDEQLEAFIETIIQNPPTPQNIRNLCEGVMLELTGHRNLTDENIDDFLN